MGHYEERKWAPDLSGGAPRRHRRGGVFHPYVPQGLGGRAGERGLSFQVAAEISEAERLCSTLDASLRATWSEGGAATASMLRLVEAVSSSAMEGYRSSAARLVASLTTGGSGAKGSDITIVRNTLALSRALRMADDGAPLSIEGVVKVQSDLLSSHESTFAGVRTEQNWVGGSAFTPIGADHVPPPPEQVRALLGDLIGYANGPAQEPIVMRAAFAHAQFETIHPFLDGNGRTGRALFHWMLRREGLLEDAVLPISAVWGASKDEYVEFLNVTRFEGDSWPAGAADGVGSFVAATIQDAALTAYQIDAQVREVRNEGRELLGSKFRADSVAHAAFGDVLANFGTTTERIARSFGVSEVAALRALDRMVDEGVLARRSRQRPHVFYSRGLVGILERATMRVEGGEGGLASPPEAALAEAGIAAADVRPLSAGVCGIWMPRARTRCALPAGHAGWPTAGHRSTA